MSEETLFEKGLKVRKEVLGEDYVNKSIAGADEFTRTMAEWSTAYCWGALWTRPGVDRRSRSIVNLSMIAALNRPHELKLHVKAALKNGLTKDEIKEIFLQVAVYCGVPAGIDSFRTAREAFKELENDLFSGKLGFSSLPCRGNTFIDVLRKFKRRTERVGKLAPRETLPLLSALQCAWFPA